MEGPLSDQIRETYRLLVWALKQLADKFGAVFVVAVVGNHGRLHHKPRAKNRVQDSFEYMIYHFLADKFDDDERINFFIPDQTDAWFEVAGHRFLLTHGDSTGARGGDGIIGAIGPIVRGEKKVRDVAGFTGDAYDVALMGHYHISVSLDNVIVNPTLKGYDEFARNVLRARPERPAQTLIFIHPEKGIIDERRIWLEDKPERRPVSDFVAIPGAP
jgi:predicted phosphodiesterase